MSNNENKIVYQASASRRPNGWFAVVKEKVSGKIVFEQKCIDENQALSIATKTKKEQFSN